MPCTDTENTPLPGDTENVLLRKLLNRLCNVTSGGGGGVSQAYVDARDAATLASANATAAVGDAATLAAALASASGLYVLKAGDTMTGALLQPAGSVGAPALSRSGDTDTGLWYPAANTWAISTAGAERVRIDSSGNVGIGDTNPGFPLAVQGAIASVPTIRLIGTGTATAFYMQVGPNFADGGSIGSRLIFLDAGTGGKRWDVGAGSIGSGTFSIANITDSVAALTILPTGNVGLNNITPLAKLHVTPTASGTDYFRIDHSDGTPRFQFGVYTGATQFSVLWLGNVTPTLSNYAMLGDGETVQLFGNTAVQFSTAGAGRWSVNSSGHFLATTDNTYDIGASGATRPRNYFGAGTVNAAGGLITGNVASLVTSSAAMNNGAAAALGTLTNAPAAGNPTKWIPIDDNGTTRYIPTW